MSVQSTTNYTNKILITSGEGLTKEDAKIKQDAGRATALAQFTVMGKRRFSLATTGTADVGNTGNGTCTAVAKLADGKNLIIGDYNLEATAAGVDGRVAGSVTADAGNTGDGTVTALAIVSGEIPVAGNWILTCTDADAGGTATAAAVFAGTGNGGISAVTTGTESIEGDYVATCIDASVSGSEIFEVIDPNGNKLENSTVAVAYSNNHLGFTIADGGTDYIVGDVYTITVTIAHGGKFTLTDPDGVDVKTDIELPGGAGGTVNVSSGGISFTITDGATDFAVDDFFTLVVSTAQGGVFKLEDPHGNLIASNLTMSGVTSGATVFNVGGMTFTLTDGATDFATGDKFAITVTADGDYVPLDPDDLLGGADVAGIYIGDAVTAAKIVAGDVSNSPVLVGGKCTIDDDMLVFENSLTLASVMPDGKSVREALEDLGIFPESTLDIDSHQS